jgi:hypothetical protein
MVALNHTVWSRLSGPEKQQMLQERLPEGFSFCRLERFERYGVSMETGVCAYEGDEFVFVPGNEVTLGWDGWPGEPDSTASKFYGRKFYANRGGVREGGGKAAWNNDSSQKRCHPADVGRT